MLGRLPCISHKPSQQVYLEHVAQNPCYTEVYISIKKNESKKKLK